MILVLLSLRVSDCWLIQTGQNLASPMAQPYEIKRAEDAQRLRCPRGHSSVAPVNDHWYCKRCADSWGDDVDPELETVVDAKTGRELRREDVLIDNDVPGCYYA